MKLEVVTNTKVYAEDDSNLSPAEARALFEYALGKMTMREVIAYLSDGAYHNFLKEAVHRWEQDQ